VFAYVGLQVKLCDTP